MRILTLIALFTALTGCSSFAKLMYRDGMTPSERRQYEAQKAEQEESERRELAEKQDKALKIGTTIEEFQSAFGRPEKKEESTEVLVGHYRYQDDPILVTFKDGKLIDYRIDEHQKSRDVAAENIENAKKRTCTSRPTWFGKYETVCE